MSNPNNAIEIYFAHLSLYDPTYLALTYPSGDAVEILGFFPRGSGVSPGG